MRVVRRSDLLLLAALMTRIGCSGLIECGEDFDLDFAVSADPLGHVEPRPCAPVAGSIVITDPSAHDPETDTCCDDTHDRIKGLAILALIFFVSAAISFFGLWTSLRPNARRAPGAEAPPDSELLHTPQGHLPARSIGSATPPARSWDAENLSRSRANSRGSARSWMSNPDGAELSEHSQSFRRSQLWIYTPPEFKPIDLREEASHAARRVGMQLQPNDLFFVNETKALDEGVTFLRLQDGRGWVFDRLTPQMTATSQALIAAGGVLCKPVNLLELRVMPEQDKAGYKVIFKAGGPLVSAVHSSSASEAGLRAGDRIIRVDGVWVMEKNAGREALHRAVSVARANGKPMILDIFRQEEDDAATGHASVAEPLEVHSDEGCA